ncbi:MAG: MBL fold metallo-hydrolase [Verrucomicrobiae bacterium]|nr:MBL fold metallo-hydrolase [Verrucomicrobiae bacterium]NNJ43447.1 MBL fold metallo-hydrolase [Akkermansiaceae bacterium]
MTEAAFQGMIMPVNLNIRSYTGGMAQTNAYLLGEGDSCLLIDAPLGTCEWLESLNELPTDLLLTHQHYDHIEDVAKLAAKGVRLHAYSPYSQDLTLEKLLQQSGISITVTPYTIDTLLEGKTEIEVGGIKFSVAHVPGHSPDSVVFTTGDFAFVGDTLFAGSVGRADLPEGDMDLLIRGIRKKLLILEASTRVFPGHGPETSIAAERQSNPYLSFSLPS